MVTLSLLTLPFFLLPWFCLAQSPFHIELQRRNRLQAKPFDYAKEADRMRQRYGFKPATARPSSRAKRGATVSIPITDQVRCS